MITRPLTRNSVFANTPQSSEKPVSDDDTLWLAIKSHLDVSSELQMVIAVCELIANSTNPMGYYNKTREYAFLRHTDGYPRKFIPLYEEMNFDCRREAQKLNEFCDKYIKLKERRDAKYVEVVKNLPPEKPVSDNDHVWSCLKSDIDFQDAGRSSAEREDAAAHAAMRRMALSDNPIGYLKKASEYISSRGGSAEFARRNMQVDYWLGNLGGLAQRRKDLQEQLEREAQAAANAVRRHGY